MSDWSGELAFASRLADAADAISMHHFRKAPGVRTKADGSLVTEADEGVERALRAEIAAAYPAHAVLGEEQGQTEAGPGGGPRWIIDPIDGTSNYAWGIPVWATLIALEVDGRVMAGVVSAPALGERYEAARGSGARRNGETIRVSETADVSASRVLYTYTVLGGGLREDEFLRLAHDALAARGFGDFWGHMLVASGSAEAMIEPVVNVWDLAPLQVIVEEAGGTFTDLEGRPRIDGGSALTTNGRVHEAVLGYFSAPAPSGADPGRPDSRE